jgi:3-hydroxybutyryl-CoA dehydrogenase
MGQGIAQVLAVAGHRVRLHEPEQARAEAGLVNIDRALARAAEQGRRSAADRTAALGRIEVAGTLVQGVEGVDLVIEAVTEDEAVKRALFAELDEAAPEATVLASNTSSIPIARLAGVVRAGRRPQVIGMHFFNPVPAMPLVEVVRTRATSDAAVAVIREVVDSLGKTSILASDRPGFVVNRMLLPLLTEAMRELEEGVASPAEIDAGARLGLGHPMGPLELADLIGLDVCLGILDVLSEGIDAVRFESPEILREKVAAGHLGRKSGRGFHAYESG